MRSSHLLQAQVRAQLVHKVVTEEGENIYFYQQELKVGTQLDGSEDRALMLWPVTAVHLIDEESPFWKMSPKDVLSSNFEILVTLDSVIESTGNTTQARSSYLPNEILWGFRFDNLISYAQKQSIYAVDCSSINRIVPDNTPRVAASQLAGIKHRRSTLSYNGLSPYQNGTQSRLSSIGDLRKSSHISSKFKPPSSDNSVSKRFSVTSTTTPITEETTEGASDAGADKPELNIVNNLSDHDKSL